MAPAGDWLTWLVLAGRGFGKTRLGAEWVRSIAESTPTARIALIAPTASDARDVMIEGESGILAVSPPWFRPTYQPSKTRLTWPNGAVAFTYSADEPDRLRGKQHTHGWGDELAAWRYPDAWTQFQLGLRLGALPRSLVTTTPRPTEIVKRLTKDPRTHVTRGATYDNAANLADAFIEEVRRKYEGTRLGRQELYAEILDDTPGALWTLSQIDAARVSSPPVFRRIVVGVDPSVSATDNSDECGIVVAGLGEDGRGYVLADLSGIMSPDAWARKAVKAYQDFDADLIVAETNNGGELVRLTIGSVDPHAAFKAVHAARAKRARAEPVAALYEQGRIAHVGAFRGLEDQMTTWDASNEMRSPDRIDALVWALTELMFAPSTAPISGFTGFRARAPKTRF